MQFLFRNDSWLDVLLKKDSKILLQESAIAKTCLLNDKYDRGKEFLLTKRLEFQVAKHPVMPKKWEHDNQKKKINLSEAIAYKNNRIRVINISLCNFCYLGLRVADIFWKSGFLLLNLFSCTWLINLLCAIMTMN